MRLPARAPLYLRHAPRIDDIREASAAGEDMIASFHSAKTIRNEIAGALSRSNDF
jgi:queuine/archaeosine tRNA-ribosyltransferase